MLSCCLTQETHAENCLSVALIFVLCYIVCLFESTQCNMRKNILYNQVTDQSGKTLNLPPEERKALVIAMSLHEKGRVALKKEDYALALVLLLEADKEFRYALWNVILSDCCVVLQYLET